MTDIDRQAQAQQDFVDWHERAVRQQRERVEQMAAVVRDRAQRVLDYLAEDRKLNPLGEIQSAGQELDRLISELDGKIVLLEAVKYAIKL